MATHEELTLIREARAGKANAQLDLGTRYIHGSEALPKNFEAAMHWLGCAAQQGSLEACQLIARHIPLACALSLHKAQTLAGWFERAFDAGETQAGLYFAKLVLQQIGAAPCAQLHERALAALLTVAHCGEPEAQWLWAGELRSRGDSEAALAWATRAAKGGIKAARMALADHAWERGDHDEFLSWALPLARVARDAVTSRKESLPGQTEEYLRLLTRCAEVLAGRADSCERDVRAFWEPAASRGERQAQLAYGLWLARLRINGEPAAFGPAVSDYEQAIQWLVLAGRQSVAEAWYALSKLYGSPLYSKAKVELQRHYRQKAAEQGHRQAQYECGMCAWNAGEQRATNALRALYWLELASDQGCAAAAEMLRQIRQSHAAALCKTLVPSTSDRNVLFTA